MNQVDKKDVQEVVNPADGSGTVVKPGEGGDDKENNLAALRKALKEKEEEIERIKAGNGGHADSDFNLGELPESKDKSADAVAVRKVFERDLKEATLQWTRANKVTPQQWAEIKKKVKLGGEETLTEIKDLIDNAYQSLPEVRQAREAQIKEEGKKEAMKQHFDDEIDLPGGGTTGGSNGGGQGGNTRMPRDTRAWGRALGLTDKELESVDPNADSNQYTILDPAYKDRQ